MQLPRNLRRGLFVAVIAIVMALGTFAVAANWDGPGGAGKESETEGGAEQRISAARPTAGPGPLETLATSCQQNLNAQGVGKVTLTSDLTARGTTATIPVPCEIVLDGGNLSLTDVTLNTDHILIRNTETSPTTRVELVGSTLQGDADSGFLMDLYGANDSVLMRRTTVAYPLSVWMRTHNQTPGGKANVVITSSTLRATAPQTEGVMVVSGDGRFSNVVMEGPGENLLFADKCSARGVTGGSVSC